MRTPLCTFFLMLMVFMVGCDSSQQPEQSSEPRFFNFRQQGWKSRRINQFINDINYSATEVPLPYYLLKSTNSDLDKADSLYKRHNRERIIEMEFAHSKEADLLLSQYTDRPYEEAVKYMAFTIKDDFYAITPTNDTIGCSGVHFERNFKIAPFKRVLLYFNNIDPNENIKLLYHDKLFGNGIVKFNFNEIPLKL